MRILVILFALLWGSISAWAAGDRPTPASETAVTSADRDFSLGIIRSEFSQLDSRDRQDPGQRSVICLKMRTYKVARERRDSDVTTWVGYTTCQPSSKYDVKRTDDPAMLVPR